MFIIQHNVQGVSAKYFTLTSESFLMFKKYMFCIILFNMHYKCHVLFHNNYHKDKK